MSREPFLAALRRRARVADLLALAAVPAALLLVFRLPEPTRRGLALSHADPSLASAYTAHFVHLDAGHLAANLAVYAVLAPVVYALCALAGRRRLFRVAFVTYLGAFPFVLSALNLALPRDVLELGFSGVAMALFGLLPLALAEYARATFDDDLDARASPALFFAATSVAALAAAPFDPRTAGVSLASLLAAALYSERALGSVRLPALGDLRRAADRTGYFELVALAAVLLVVVPFVALRGAAVGAANPYVHLLGFALGYVSTYVTALVVAE
ncbi:hypothetical protein [Halosegnis marinus]|uniref:Rhomboid family protein n=1 Tax=Halosegnis marinus TaxID=3034023 RepID=A0ABD5ZQ83_9EURY|nr:hypothetical protein [Halosegnis sp. DT85]